MRKVLEKIYATRLSYLANISNKLLHHTQMGGRKQRSVVDTALLLYHYIQSERNKKKKKGRKCLITSTVLLDVKGAFDHVKKQRLLRILCNLHLPYYFTKWVKCFLSNRKIQLLFEGQIQKQVDIITGVPQGSPILPVLFLIYVRGIT